MAKLSLVMDGPRLLGIIERRMGTKRSAATWLPRILNTDGTLSDLSVQEHNFRAVRAIRKAHGLPEKEGD